MRKSKQQRGTDHRVLRQAEAGIPVAEVCRKGGFSDATFYKWREVRRHGGV